MTDARGSVTLAEATIADPSPIATAAQLLVEALIQPTPYPVFRPAPNQVFLSWSDDRGHSFGNPVGVSRGGVGGYLTSLQWQRLGMGRDRVFCLEWSGSSPTALQGAWIDIAPSVS